MAKNEKNGRSQAEERFDRARRTNDEAKSIIDLEREALRKKTARLRKLRLAQEAEAGITELDKKPSQAKKAKAVPKKRK